MNRVFSTVWNHSLGAWVVTSEHATRQGKRSARRLACVVLASGLGLGALPVLGADLPTGGQVVHGSAQIGTPSGNQLVIDQGSNKLAINWQTFDIAAGNKVTFNQPGTDSIALNRVLGTDGSKIMGQLDANGRVFIVNPNGVLFGAGAQVNVGGLVASTLDISDADFAAGNYQFKGDGTNQAVVNQGAITAADGGAVALLGGTVSNQGVIVANQGTVALAAGNKVTLDFAGDGLLNVQVDEAVVDALVENHQLIKANGGQVLLTAHAGEALLKTVVNNTGIIEAQTLGNKDGKIVLLGSFDGGTVQVAGTLDASAPKGGNGGFIEASGAQVKIADTAKVTTQAANGKTGTWLIDPRDINIAASGDSDDTTFINAAFLGGQLDYSNVAIETTGTGTGVGNITINDALAWDSSNTLTLKADNNIQLNAAITASNGGLTLNAQNSIGTSANGTVNVGTFTLASGNWQQLGSTLPAFSATDFRLNGGTFLRATSGDGSATPWQLTDVYGLQGMRGFLGKNFALANNIDASGTATWNGGLGFNPIGDSNNSYSGAFDGLGHTISGLTIARPSQSYVGLFGSVRNGGTLRNIGLLGGAVTGSSNVGGLVGSIDSGSIGNAYATDAVDGTNRVGGLVGQASLSSIRNAYATGTVSGNYSVGGLVGFNSGGGAGFSDVYATGTVTGARYVGGLVGESANDSISNAYATGAVIGDQLVGGLVGMNSNGVISNTYATGAVSGSASFGGLFGYNNSSLTSSFYAITDAQGLPINSGGSYSTYGQAKTRPELSASSTFAGWDLATTGGSNAVWRIYEGSTNPMLRSFLKAVTVTVDPIAGKTYDGTVASGTISYTPSLAGALLDGSASYASSSANAGSYSTTNGTLLLGGLYSGQQGYDISYASGSSLTITPKTLTVSGVTAGNKTYDGTKAAAITGGALAGMIGSETVSLGSLSGTFADQNAGNGIAVTVTGGTLSNGSNGGLASNYTVASVTGLSANIAQKALTVTGVTVASKAYDGNTKATISGGTLNGLVTGETLSLSGQSGTFYDQNAGNGKAVTVTGATLSDGTGGGLASNYTVSNATGATGNITQKALTVGGVTAADKVYDGGLAAVLSGGTLSGMVGSETLGLSSLSGVFGDKNVGSGKTVTVTGGALSDGTGGGLASNYTVGPVTGLSASITQKALTLSGLAASAKAYDGNTKATLTGGTLDGLVTGETLSVSGQTGTFSDKNAGTGKVITVTGTTLVDGSGLASNYSLANPTGVTGDITKKALTITGITATNRAYTGGTAVSLGGTVILDGLVGAEGVGVGGMVGVFADKNVGTGKAVTIAGAVLTVGSNGGLVSNYTISNPTGVTANITKATISAVTNIVIDSKVYDGGLNAIVNAAGATFGGIKSGDSLTVSATTATFADKNVGTGKTVNISGIGLGGTDAGNYNLTTTTGSSTGVITPKALTIVGMSAVSKVYDGNTKVSVTGGAIDGLVGSETLGVTGLTVAFDTKDAGTGKTVTATGTTLVNGGNGGLASNYTIANPTGFTANITPKALTVSGMTAGTRVYDGTTAATLAGGSLSGVVSGETLVLSGGSGVFANKNAGTAKAVTVSGVSLANGTGLASNYSVTNPTNVTGSITPKALTVSDVTADSKVYDGNTLASLSAGSLSGLIGSETLTLGGLTGAFDNQNAGSNKAVTVSGATLADGTGLASNYSVTNPTNVTGSITPKALTVTGVTAGNKVYDGNTLASLSAGSLSGLIGNETLALGGLTGAFDNQNAGTNKAVIVSGATLADGAGLASNYTITNPTGVTADITRANLTVTANNDSKTYDGLAFNGGNGLSYSGFVNNEDFSVLRGSLSYGGSAHGAINAGRYALSASGLHADNYTIGFVDGALTINKAAATVTANSGTVTYNGLPQNVSGFTASGLVNGETESVLIGVTTMGGSGTNAGTYSHSASGIDGNYVLTFVDGTLTINKAALTVTANNASKTYDGLAYNGSAGVSYEGFVNGENTSVLGGDLSYASGTSAGRHDINASGLNAANYAISYAPGTLIISPAAPVTPAGSPIMSSPLAPGLYVQVISGMIYLTNPAGSLTFSPGQFGNSQTPTPRLGMLPASLGLYFSPPPAFSSALPAPQPAAPQLAGVDSILGSGIRLPQGI